MVKTLPLHVQAKNMQDVLTECFNAPTNIYTAHFLFLLGRNINVHSVRPEEITAVNDALIYTSLKTAFVRGVEFTLNDRQYRDSKAAAKLRPVLDQINLALNPV